MLICLVRIRGIYSVWILPKYLNKWDFPLPPTANISNILFLDWIKFINLDSYSLNLSFVTFTNWGSASSKYESILNLKEILSSLWRIVLYSISHFVGLAWIISIRSSSPIKLLSFKFSSSKKDSQFFVFIFGLSLIYKKLISYSS